MREQLDNSDALVARLASNHHGVLTTAELNRLGIDKSAIARRVTAGRLFPVHRGVFAVGHPGLSPEGRWMAAVKALGDGAVLSHRSAAELWRMLPRADGDVHVTVASGSGRARRNGIVVHRSPTMARAETTMRERIPVTMPERTIADLRRGAGEKLARRATREAEYLRLPLGETNRDGTRSEPERAFLALCRRHRLPLPAVNVRIGPFTVDFLWPAQRVIVEIDAYGTHRGRQAFEDDRARDVELELRGYLVIRLTDRQICDDPRTIATTIRAILARRAKPGSPHNRN